MDIQLVNPLDDVVVFEVALTGDGLLGEARYLLKDLCSGPSKRLEVHLQQAFRL